MYPGFHCTDFPESAHLELSTHVLQMVYFWLRSTSNQGHFAWKRTFSVV